MILWIKINLDLVLKEGKKFKWENCECCNCHVKMWGHGYVARYFAEVASIVFLKRYRCWRCKAVVVVRPEGYWPKIRSSISTIYTSLISRLRDHCWSSCPRQRGGHWLARFVRHAMMEKQSNLVLFLKHSFEENLRFLP